MSIVNEPKIWDRQPTDTPKSYAALREYLALGKDRSYQAVADIIGKSQDQVKMWGRRYKWVDRATAYDDWVNSGVDDTRREAEGLLQARIITDEARDYESLRSIWERLVNEAVSPGQSIEDAVNNFNRLVLARQRLDTMARRMAGLPNTWHAKPEIEIPAYEKDTIYLDFDKGPLVLGSGEYGGSLTAATSTSEGSEGSTG